ncbi:hypothetical protein BS78_K150700 [Paspalum vaginatum]|uniref:peptide-methionine (S)-S-oxide reductase n=1 Tax=Paspalum vaginatum TaxID=158149 RepID=A0A9W7X7V4_9POAL|nr:hypothetical protein BS78_K150700 [Paspalum vaginatum]
MPPPLTSPASLTSASSPLLLGALHRHHRRAAASVHFLAPRRKARLPAPAMSWLGKLGLSGWAAARARRRRRPRWRRAPTRTSPRPGTNSRSSAPAASGASSSRSSACRGVTRTEVGYSQGNLHDPTYEDVCTGATYHNEVVRVQYDPAACKYDDLLDTFWARHDPTTPNRQGNDVGTQYRSGIYYYTPEQEKAARESLEKQQKLLNRKIVTEILPAKRFYRAEEYHQQYLEKGGRFGFRQSATKGCNDPIRCYG